MLKTGGKSDTTGDPRKFRSLKRGDDSGISGAPKGEHPSLRNAARVEPEYVLRYTAYASHKKEEDIPENQRLTREEKAVVDGYKKRFNKIAYNNNPKYRHVGMRCVDLADLAKLFMTGHPWKNNQKLRTLATPVLTELALTYEKRLREVFKSAHGKDVGKIDD